MVLALLRFRDRDFAQLASMVAVQDHTSMSATGRALHLARQRDRESGQHQHGADHREGIAESHHQRLVLHGSAQRDDRLLVRGGGVAEAVRDEIIGGLGDPAPHLLAAGTAILGIMVLGDSAAPIRLLCIGLILSGVIGLKLVSGN
jgi:hypothetical protein